MNTSTKGNLSLLKVAAALAAKDGIISIPLGDGAPYDMLWKRNGSIKRIQVKTGWLDNNAICFNTCSKADCRNQFLIMAK